MSNSKVVVMLAQNSDYFKLECLALKFVIFKGAPL